MQKIILDTNVIVSALISSNIPRKILDEFVLSKKVLVCLSQEVFEEYIEVLNRDKLAKYRDFKAQAEIVLNRLREISRMYTPQKEIRVLTDTSDNKFLELAAISTADFLITGNTSDFTLNEFENTRIVTPREFLDCVSSS